MLEMKSLRNEDVLQELSGTLNKTLISIGITTGKDVDEIMKTAKWLLKINYRFKIFLVAG